MPRKKKPVPPADVQGPAAETLPVAADTPAPAPAPEPKPPKPETKRISRETRRILGELGLERLRVVEGFFGAIGYGPGRETGAATLLHDGRVQVLGEGMRRFHDDWEAALDDLRKRGARSWRVFRQVGEDRRGEVTNVPAGQL